MWGGTIKNNPPLIPPLNTLQNVINTLFMASINTPSISTMDYIELYAVSFEAFGSLCQSKNIINNLTLKLATTLRRYVCA